VELLLVFLVAAGALVPFVVWWQAPRRRLARAPEKLLGALEGGDRVRVRGVAQRAEGSLTTPFTGRRCIGFRAVVEELDDGTWTECFRVEDCRPFTLVADGAEARVEGPFLLGLEIDARSDDGLPRDELAAIIRQGAPWVSPSSGRRAVRYHEAALEDGDPIFVLGRASIVVDPRGYRDAPRAQPTLRIISGTPRDLTVVADEDQPGVLDPFG
jgi:hypothetical protein